MVKILGIVATILTAGVIVLLCLGRTVPTELWSSVTLVLGAIGGNAANPVEKPPVG